MVRLSRPLLHFAQRGTGASLNRRQLKRALTSKATLMTLRRFSTRWQCQRSGTWQMPLSRRCQRYASAEPCIPCQATVVAHARLHVQEVANGVAMRAGAGAAVDGAVLASVAGSARPTPEPTTVRSVRDAFMALSEEDQASLRVEFLAGLGNNSTGPDNR